MTYGKLIQEMDSKLQFPGLSNTWTMPVENRLDMELTGIKTPLGLKIQGPNLEGIQQVGAQVQQILSAIPEMRSIFAERVSQGFYLNIEVVFHSVTEAAVLILPTIYALTGGLILQRLLGYNFSVAVWVGYIALFGIAVETCVVMVVYLHEALNHRLKSGVPLRHEDIEAAVIEGAVHRLRPKLMTVCVVLASLIPILWETGVGADVMKPIAAPIVGGMITSTIHVLILVPVFFALMKERALRSGNLCSSSDRDDRIE